MDLFQAICTGLGLALAAGLVVGAVVPSIMPAWGAMAGAIPLGVLLAAAALSAEDEAVWIALPIGAIGASIAAFVCRNVTASAARREGGEGPARPSTALSAIVTTAAALVAVLALFVPYASLAALGALGWLAISRRRKEAQKHEGLRILR